MTLFRSLLATLALIAVFALSQPSFAQDQNQAERMKAPPTTITGCVAKADAGDQYMLVDPASGSKIVLNGTGLEKHANHIVKVTGTPSDDGKAFNVAKVEHVADSCPSK